MDFLVLYSWTVFVSCVVSGVVPRYSCVCLVKLVRVSRGFVVLIWSRDTLFVSHVWVPLFRIELCLVKCMGCVG